MTENILALEKYLRELAYKGLSPRTIKPRQFLLAHFLQSIVKPLDQVTREDVLDWIDQKQVSRITQRNYRYWIQEFLKFLGNNLEIPRLRVKEKLLSEKDLVTPEEVHAMLLALDHPRDRALIHVLYETGARASEILRLSLQDIEFGETLTKVRLDGKTGERIVPIIESVPALQTWLNHAKELQPDEPIWQSQKGSLSYSRLLDIVQKVSKRVLGRMISPHRLRHSCATEFAKSPHFNMPLLCERFGWVQGSSIVKRYFHLAGKDLEAATLAMHGQEPITKHRDSPLKPRICPRCHTKNPIGARYCTHCSLILDEGVAQRIIERDHDIIEFMDWLVNNPEKVRALRDEMRKHTKRGT